MQIDFRTGEKCEVFHDLFVECINYVYMKTIHINQRKRGRGGGGDGGEKKG